MTTYTNVKHMTEVEQVEAEIRSGLLKAFNSIAFEYKSGRFYINGKRASDVASFRQQLADAMAEHYFQAMDQAIADLETAEITVAEAGAILGVSDVRIRRMVKEGGLRYGAKRAHVLLKDVQNQERIRHEKATKKAAAKKLSQPQYD